MRPRALAIILLLCAVHVGANLHWLSQDAGVQFTDAAYHWGQVVEARDALTTGRVVDLEQVEDKQRYGELVYGVATAVSLVMGPNPGKVLLGLSVLFWPLLLFGAYRLAWELAPPERRERAGLIAAAFVGLIPGLFNYSRTLVLDLPLAIAVLWANIFLIRLLRERSRRTAIQAALWALVALNIKVNAVAFLAGPLWVATKPWRRHLLIAAPLAAALGAAGLALTSRFGAFATTLGEATWPGAALAYAGENALSAWPGDWLRFAWAQSWEVAYFTTLQSLSPPILLVVVAASAHYFGRRRGCEDPLARSQRDAAFWWFLLPTLGVIAVLRGLYDERYVLPLLPLLGCLVAVALAELRRPALTLAVLVGAALNFAVVSFGVLPTARPLACATVPGWTSSPRVASQIWLCGLYPGYEFMDRPSTPQPNDGEAVRALQWLEPLAEELGQPLRAAFVDDLYDLFYGLLHEEVHAHQTLDPAAMLLVTRCRDAGWIDAMFGSVADLDAVLATHDLVVVRYGSPTEGPDQGVRGRRCTVFWGVEDRFALRDELPLKDGTTLRAYLRRPEPPEARPEAPDDPQDPDAAPRPPE